MALTAKQAAFVKEYLVDLNATQAAIRAGYSGRTAEKIGSENLHKPEIQDAIQAAMHQRSKKTEITAERVLEELARIAFADATKLARVVDGEDGPLVELTPTSELSEAQRSAIAGIKQGKYGVEIASCDKLKALELLGRHLAMFTDKTESKVDGVMKIELSPELEGLAE